MKSFIGDIENICAEVSETNSSGTTAVDECIIDDDVTLEEYVLFFYP